MLTGFIEWWHDAASLSWLFLSMLHEHIFSSKQRILKLLTTQHDMTLVFGMRYLESVYKKEQIKIRFWKDERIFSCSKVYPKTFISKNVKNEQLNEK